MPAEPQSGAVRVHDLVEWRVQAPPPGLVVARTALALARVGLGLVAFALDPAAAPSPGGARPTWRVPADRDCYVDIAPLRLRGTASWLPRPSAGSCLVTASSRAVWVVPAHDERPALRVPVEALTVVAAHAGRRRRRPRSGEAVWTLTLTDGTDLVSLQGCWLSLAWIGHLAGWPEPAVGTTTRRPGT